MKKVYLAGPLVFHPAAKAIFEYLQDLCTAANIEGVSPVDAKRDLANLEGLELARAIRAANIELIQGCHGVIACMTPFRGPSADVGTAWEMGFAEAWGIPVVAWSEDLTDYHTKVPHEREGEKRYCTQSGMLVEDFGLNDNLMLSASPNGVEGSFEAALATIKELI